MDFEKAALGYHASEPAGKIATTLTKPLTSQEELSLAYSPGVAGPCREIHADPEKSFIYTGRANLIGVISNGTAVLGLGDIGPAAAKPVMEGKAMLFKKFADIDVFDLELNTADPDAFIAAVAALEPTFGGINLEDIKAPDCFYIEETLRKRMKIPVFHDDQHGTAIIASAAFLNAIEITQRDISTIKVVFSGGGAAAVACADLFIKLGVKKEHLTMCDRTGVIYEGRTQGMNPYKEKFAVATTKRTLSEALDGADAFVGVSGPGVLSESMITNMAKNPIIFALANPDPEIMPDVAKRVRPDAIIATGRSDFPNQVNNVLGFPFIFRGALDVQATTINDEMKLAATYAIANLAKEDVPEEVLRAYAEKEGYTFGRDYLIPKPVDPRVLLRVAPAVAKAAMDSGVARSNVDLNAYTQKIERILGPTRRIIRQLRNDIATASVKQKRKPRLVIPHGHDHRAIKAAAHIYYEGDVDLILLGAKDTILQKAHSLGFKKFASKANILDPLTDANISMFAKDLFNLRQRKGVSLTRAEQVLRNNTYFAAMMVRHGLADGMISGLVEPYVDGLRPVLEIFGSKKDQVLAGIQMVVYRNKLYFIADCTINIEPTSEELCEIAITAANFARHYTKEPIRVGMLSFSSFGSNKHPKAKRVARAVELLQERKVDFEFDGEIQGDAALNSTLREQEFPFNTLGGDANVLIFPDLTSANLCYKILTNLTDATSTGPILVGPEYAAQVIERGASTEETINMLYVLAEQAFCQNGKLL